MPRCPYHPYLSVLRQALQLEAPLMQPKAFKQGAKSGLPSQAVSRDPFVTKNTYETNTSHVGQKYILTCTF